MPGPSALRRTRTSSGLSLTLDDAPHTVIGVLAEGFYFPSPEEEIWRPSAITSGSSFSGLGNALGRLRVGVPPERAATEVRTILQHTDDQPYAANTAGYRSAIRLYDGSTDEALMHDAQVIPLREEMVREYRPALLALTAAMALVLLIACSNVAGLLLARGVTRQRALAVCAALGAGRGRIMRQLLTESVVLSLSGGALGLAAAVVVLHAVPALVPGDIARLDEVEVDGVVLAFTLGLSVAVGVVFGAAPAFSLVAARSGARLERGPRAVDGRLPAAALGPHAGGAGGGAGGAGPGAAGRGRTAPAQLRGVDHN